MRKRVNCYERILINNHLKNYKINRDRNSKFFSTSSIAFFKIKILWKFSVFHVRNYKLKTNMFTKCDNFTIKLVN